VKIEPGEAHEILARIWYLRGDSQRAEQEARLALQTAHDPAYAYLVLGSIDRDRGDFPGALRDLDLAAANAVKKGKPRLQGLHLTRGDALARLNRFDEAEREFRAEVDEFPREPRAYSALIMLLAIEHRPDDATKVVLAAVKASPVPHTFVILAETLKAIGDERGALYWVRQGLQAYPNDAELRSLPRRLAGQKTN
jgi:Flp pilus assembly protein TadD